MPGNLPILTKWDGIIDELNDYERKAPGNGLVELEDFIMNPLNEVTLATCAKYASTVNMISDANDFFVSILINIQEKLHEQCVALSGYASVDNYTSLSSLMLTWQASFCQKADGTSPDADPTSGLSLKYCLKQGIKATLAQAKIWVQGKNALTF
jgi:hypothetical protein